MERLDVFVSIKPKPKQPSKVRFAHASAAWSSTVAPVERRVSFVLQSVIVKSIERNASNMYEARRRLLSAEGEAVAAVKCAPLLQTGSPNFNGLSKSPKILLLLYAYVEN